MVNEQTILEVLESSQTFEDFKNTMHLRVIGGLEAELCQIQLQVDTAHHFSVLSQPLDILLQRADYLKTLLSKHSQKLGGPHGSGKT